MLVQGERRVYHLTGSLPLLREEVVTERVDPQSSCLFVENTNLHKLPKRCTGVLAVVRSTGGCFLSLVARLDPTRDSEPGSLAVFKWGGGVSSCGAPLFAAAEAADQHSHFGSLVGEVVLSKVKLCFVNTTPPLPSGLTAL